MNVRFKQCNPANYVSGAIERIKYLVIHYDGNYGATAAANAAYFARECAGVSAHYFVDEASVWQSVPDRDVAWHCGCKTGYRHPACRNANSIGVEICMLDKAGKVRQGSIDNAVRLVRELMAKYGITAAYVLRHYDVTGKQCPAPMVADVGLWKGFKAAVSAPERIEDDMTEQEIRNIVRSEIAAIKAADEKRSVSEYAAEAWNSAEEHGIMDGSAPGAPVLREQLATVMQRVGLIGK